MKNNLLDVNNLSFKAPHVDDMDEYSMEVNNNLQSTNVNNINNGSIAAMIINNPNPSNWLPNNNMSFVEHSQPKDSIFSMLNDPTFDVYGLLSIEDKF